MTATPAVAGTGGATVPVLGRGAGGAEYGTALKRSRPPRATTFRIGPRTLAVGRLPEIVVRVDAGDGAPVRARIDFTPVRGSGGHRVRLSLGHVAVGRTLRVAWPRGRALSPGRYVVRLHAVDVAGRALERRGRTPGRTTLTVSPKRPQPKARPKPGPKPPPAPSPSTPVPAPVVSSARSTFPVAGPHAYGDGFGVGRVGHRHQGVDITASEGTPLVSPTAGTVRFTGYQASAAGEYVVERLADGRDIFLAHCVRHSTAVAPGQAVATGQRLCLLGSTGDATGPHLHFELWPQGWRDLGGTAPADPLAQLRAWD